MLSHKPQVHNDHEDDDDNSSPRKGMKNEFDMDLKVVDFGIFGSTSGINPEKIHAGSLKYMAPEIL